MTEQGTLTSCPLTCTCVLWHVHTHTNSTNIVLESTSKLETGLSLMLTSHHYTSAHRACLCRLLHSKKTETTVLPARPISSSQESSQGRRLRVWVRVTPRNKHHLGCGAWEGGLCLPAAWCDGLVRQFLSQVWCSRNL